MIWLTPDRLIAACMSCLFLGASFVPAGKEIDRQRIVDEAPAAGRALAAVGEGTAERRPLTLRRDGQGLFRTVVLCNGVPVRMIVDTGATLSILSEADAQRIFQSREARDGGAIQTVGGLKPLRLHRLDSVEIAGKKLGDLEVGVVSGAGFSVVGIDWLEKLGPILLEPGLE